MRPDPRRFQFLGLLVVLAFSPVPGTGSPSSNAVARTVSQQPTVGMVDGARLLDNLKTLLAELRKMEADLVNGTSLPDRKRMKYGDYVAAYTTWAGKVSQCNSLLAQYYEQVGAVYRNDPRSATYREVRTIYTTASEAYLKVSEAFQKLDRPDTTRQKVVFSRDARLNETIAAAAKAAPAPLSVEKVRQAEVVSYLGNFDGVDLYLLAWGDEAVYVASGWHERTTRPDGQVSNQTHREIACSDPFPLSRIRDLPPARHLETALSRKFAPVPLKGEQYADVSEFLELARSYTTAD